MVQKQVLLKTQKNEIFQILLDADLEPANFSWTEEPSITCHDLIVSKLKYRDGHFYFQFDFSRNKLNRYCEFSPGEERAVEGEGIENSWLLQKNKVQEWAHLLKKEIDTPDLWQEIQKYQATFSLAPPAQLLNEPIPAYEAEKISNALQSLASQIEQQFELTNQQSKFVNSKLDYLAEAAKRQGHLDWIHTCIGVLITIAMALGMAPAQANRFWQLAKELLGQFIHLIGP